MIQNAFIDRVEIDALKNNPEQGEKLVSFIGDSLCEWHDVRDEHFRDLLEDRRRRINTVFGQGKYRLKAHLVDGGASKIYLVENLPKDQLEIWKYPKPLTGKNNKELTPENLLNHIMQEIRASILLRRIYGDPFPEDLIPCSALAMILTKSHDKGDAITPIQIFPASNKKPIWRCHDNGKTMKLKEKTYLTLCLLQAIEKCHHAKLVHSDINFGNVLIGKDQTVACIDFGLSKIMRDGRLLAESFASRVDGGEFLTGTTEFIPPEIHFSGYPIPKMMEVDGEKIDVFSIGLLLFFLFSNKKQNALIKELRKLFERGGLGIHQFLIAYQQLLEKIKIAFQKKIRHLPAPLQEVLLNTLAFDPKKRPSVAELISIIEWNG